MKGAENMKRRKIKITVTDVYYVIIDQPETEMDIETACELANKEGIDWFRPDETTTNYEFVGED